MGRFKNRFGGSGKKSLKKIAIGLMGVALIGAMGFFVLGGKDSVKYTILEEKQIPQQIISEVIPQYRQLERALACVVDGKIYVVATRGEKPTSGYEISIDKMYIEKDGGKTNLVVCTVFKDPKAGMSLSQVLTYPFQVAETDLKSLPEGIQLKVQYE
ncbi:MAG: protease complex subunit PrcB family protein [Anaerovoracaceae bacterium]